MSTDEPPTANRPGSPWVAAMMLIDAEIKGAALASAEAHQRREKRVAVRWLESLERIRDALIDRLDEVAARARTAGPEGAPE